MGKRAQEIIKIDQNKLIEMLNKAVADEWFAYYQYWLGAKVTRGPMRLSIISELDKHAAEELNHANLLSDRIIQLGGTPVLSPQAWYDLANCKYIAPSDPFVKTILEQNLEGERCAINVYDNLAKQTKDKDYATYDLVIKILEDEIEHEEDLQNFLEDLSHINIK